MERPAHVYVSYIATTPEKLWQALTHEEFTRQYWPGARLVSDWKPGSPVLCLGGEGAVAWQGEVLEADQPRRLSYTFHMQVSEDHRADTPSRVTFEIEPAGDVVKLTLTQDRFLPGSVTWETTRYGWPAIISSLKSLLETGRALPFAGFNFRPSRAN